MKNKTKIKNILKQHLINLGFEFFDNYDQYDIWKENYLGKINIPFGVKKKYIKFLEKNTSKKNYSLGSDFYDFIAKSKKLMLITHSQKSNEILNSGLAIIKELKENSNVLDVGCNSGYLTSFYAKKFPHSNIVGVDKSKYSILQALKIFKLNNYSNLVLSYDYNILNKYRFNFISDTQCFSTLKKKELLFTLDLLNNYLYSNVKIISISNLRNEEDAHKFLKLFSKKNFFVESLSPLFVKTLYGMAAYTKIIFTKKKIEKDYDLQSYFINIRKKIFIVNLFNLN